MPSYIEFLECTEKNFQDFLSQIENIAQSGNVSKILDFIKKYPSHDINASKQDGTTALYLAVQFIRESFLDEMKVLDALLNVPEVNVNATNKKNGHTILMKSAIGKNFSIAEKLLATKQADINAVDNTNSSALHHSLRKNNIRLAKALLVEENIICNAPDHMMDTPLHIAAQFGLTEIVEELVKKGVDINALNVRDETPLHLAVKNNHPLAGNILLNMSKIDITIRDKDNHTAAWYATQSRHFGFKSLAAQLHQVEVQQTDLTVVTYAARLAQINYPDDKIPEDFLCPVSKMIMENPITLPSGHTFDFQSIQNIRKANLNTSSFSCPLSRIPITVPESSILTNVIIKNLINKFVTEQEGVYKKMLEAEQTIHRNENAEALSVLGVFPSKEASSSNKNSKTTAIDSRDKFLI